MNNLEITWVAVGIALTTATQLRSERPVGVGEVMLAAWMLLVGFRLLTRRDYLVTTFTKVTFWFWIVSFASLALGFMMAEPSGLASPSEDIYHDAIAFAFSSVLCMALSLSIHSKNNTQKLLLTLMSFIIVSLVIMVLFSSFLGFLNPWYAKARFQGWTINPNQLALVVSVLPFFSLELANQSSNKYIKIWCLALVVISFVMGIAVQSDALILAWVIGALSVILLLPYLTISNRGSSLSAAIITLITMSVVLFIYLVFGHSFYEGLNPIAADVYANDSQGSGRLTLWRNGIAAASHSPIFGLGPGAHSGLTGPLLNVEAHNTFIDWAGSSGIVGLISYVALLGWVGWNAWRARSVILVAAIISLVVFTCFHFVLRHAIFWFYLLAVASLSIQKLKTRYSLDNSTQQTKNTSQRVLQP